MTASSKCAQNTSNPNCVNVSHTSSPSATAQRRFFKHASRYTLQQNTSSNERAAYASRNVGRGTRNEGGNVVDGYGSRTRGTRKCHRFIRGMCDIERILTQLGRASSSANRVQQPHLHYMAHDIRHDMTLQTPRARRSVPRRLVELEYEPVSECARSRARPAPSAVLLGGAHPTCDSYS